MFCVRFHAKHTTSHSLSVFALIFCSFCVNCTIFLQGPIGYRGESGPSGPIGKPGKLLLWATPINCNENKIKLKSLSKPLLPLISSHFSHFRNAGMYLMRYFIFDVIDPTFLFRNLAICFYLLKRNQQSINFIVFFILFICFCFLRKNG